MMWKLKQFIREVRAWMTYRDDLAERRDIEQLVRERGGSVTWESTHPPLPALRTLNEGSHDCVVYRGEQMTRHEAERHLHWDNLMGLRAEARRLVGLLDDTDAPLTQFKRFRELLEE